MRLTLVTSYFPTGPGSYRGHTAFQMLQRLKEQVEVAVICPLTVYPWAAGLVRNRAAKPDTIHQPGGIPTTYVEYPGVPLLSRPFNGAVCERRILAHVERTRPDVILNYWLYPDGFAAFRAGRRLRVPAVVGAIGSDLRRISDPLTRRLTAWTLRRAAGVVTVSEELRRRAIAMGADAGSVTTILNGCDTAVFYPLERGEARRAVEADPADEIVLYVGRLMAAKGVAELIAAFATVAAARPRARLAIVGEGPERQRLEQQAETAGVGGRVSFLGRLPSVAEWMRAADVFCLPSHSEGSPNVITEALACGSPVVATDVGGIPELVTADSGILVPPRQPAALARALESALARKWDGAAITAAARRSWDQVAQETLGACRRAVERAQRPGYWEGVG